jgi:DNA-directed RNA polymerase specialized sigma24 family protein
MKIDNLAGEFDSFQGELKSFLLRMTASVPDSEDLVQDTYIKAQTSISSFRGGVVAEDVGVCHCCQPGPRFAAHA